LKAGGFLPTSFLFCGPDWQAEQVTTPIRPCMSDFAFQVRGHPITDCAHADLEVLRDLYSGPPLFLRLRGFDCCLFKHVNVFDNHFCCVAVRLPGGPFDLGNGNATDHRPLVKRFSLQVDGSVKGAFQPDAGLLPAFHFGSAKQGACARGEQVVQGGPV
jgi:hypothetical protein